MFKIYYLDVPTYPLLGTYQGVRFNLVFMGNVLLIYIFICTPNPYLPIIEHNTKLTPHFYALFYHRYVHEYEFSVFEF